MPLPARVPFEGLTGKLNPRPLAYRKLGFRPPCKGEYYLSGAIVMAYRAPNDLSTAYQVVEPVKD